MIFSPVRQNTGEPIPFSPRGAYNALICSDFICLDVRAGSGSLPLLRGAIAVEPAADEPLLDAAERAHAELFRRERPPDDRRTALVVSDTSSAGEAAAAEVVLWLQQHKGVRRVHTLTGGAEALAGAHGWLFGRAAELPELPNQISEAGDLYLGSHAHAESAAGLGLLGVTDVVSVLSHKPVLEHIEGARHLFLQADDADFQQMGPIFEEAAAFISAAHASGRKVLVHCERGASRSASVVVAYLMTSRRMGVDAALSIVRRCRYEASPNPGFLSQLRELEASLRLSADESPSAPLDF